MNWKALLDWHDSRKSQTSARVDASLDAKHAFENGSPTEDIARKYEKFLWADAVILHFPLWEYSMPAILMKRWVDRGDA